MKKILSLFLVLTILLSLSACAKVTNSPDSSDVPADSTSVTEMQDSTEAAPQLAVEDFEVVRYDTEFLTFKVKFRNISDVDLDGIIFDYQLLDANGDILDVHSCGATSVSAGQAIWTNMFSVGGDVSIDDIAAITFVSAPKYIPSRNPIAKKVVFEIPSGRILSDNVQMVGNTESLERFRNYLQEHGPMCVVTEKIDNSNSLGSHQVTVEATDAGIQVTYSDEITTLVNKASAFGKSVLQFTLTPNIKNVNANVEYYLESTDGYGHSDIRSCATTILLNIHDYRSGDKLSVDTDYTQVDENGKSTKQEGMQLELVLTNPCADAMSVLSQVLQESGLDVTMADLGFANY